MLVALYVLAVLAAIFIVSGVVPRYREVAARVDRVRMFSSKYAAYVEARDADYQTGGYGYGSPAHGEESSALRAWLVGRRNDMQRDAESVGKGVIYVAPPPAIGGGRYLPHYYFSDLFDEQSYADHDAQFRQDELATTEHELDRLRDIRRRDLYNPWSWIRLAFERLIGLPRYMLRRAGFGTAVTDSTGAKIVSAVWSALVGIATIGAFVVGLIQLSKKS